LSGSHHRQRGLSMIELMIAVTLSSIMLIGVLALFISSKKGYAVQDAAGRLGENARFSSVVLDEALRMADFWGGIGNSLNVTLSANTGTLSTGAGCNPLAVDSSSAINSGILGYSGGTFSSLPAAIQTCIGNTNNYVPNTDVILVRYADPEPTDTVQAPAWPTAPTLTATNFYVLSQTGFSGWVFQGSEYASAPTGLQQAGADPVFARPYIVQLFFIRPCAVPATGTCQKTDDGGNPRPTLVEASFQGNSITAQPIVDGVEMMKFFYGVDATGTKKASQFETAASVTAAGGVTWEHVVSVEYSLVVRGDAGDNANLDTNTYSLVDGSSYTPSSVTTLTLDTVPPQNYLHRLYNATVLVRNRVRY
jgi:type IV pilus assembly protein PilW